MKHVLVIAPHHDDEALGCGGSIAKITQQGVKVSLGVVVDGASGVPEALDREAAMEVRKRETKNAGKALGISEFHFLDFEDRGFVYSREALQSIIRLIRQCCPTSIWFPHENDGDIEHKIVHQLVREASWMAASPYLPELGPPAPRIKQLLGYEVWTPMQSFQMMVDITATIGTKLEAIACYASQLKQASYGEIMQSLNRYRAGMSSEDGYAEVFQVLHTTFEVPE